MKLIHCILLCVILLCGCTKQNFDSKNAVDEINIMVPSPSNQQNSLKNYSNVNNNIKNEITKIKKCRTDFEVTRNTNIDPCKNLATSTFMVSLKAFLSKKESLAVSSAILWDVLDETDYVAMDKKVVVHGEELNIRIISYCFPIWEQVDTDIEGLNTKWIFVQCWNENHYFFKTLVDGGTAYLIDYMATVIHHELTLVLNCRLMVYYPRPITLYAWKLSHDEFIPAILFTDMNKEGSRYTTHHQLIESPPFTDKWDFYTNGAVLFVAKGEFVEELGIVGADVSCELDWGADSFILSSVDQRDVTHTVHVRFSNDKFIIED